jgi:hypothetical protein
LALWGRSEDRRRSCASSTGDGLRIDLVAPGEAPQARLTMLYRSTDRLCRCGAAVKNLSHSASFRSWKNNVPSNPGIKHLGGLHCNGRLIRELPSPCVCGWVGPNR